MSPVNWHQIMNVKEDDLSDEQVEDLYHDLLKHSVDDEENITRLRRLFVVTRSVMQTKGMQAEVAMEELEQMARNQGRMSARREKELNEEIKELQQQLKSISQVQRVGGDTQVLKKRLMTEDLERENQQLKQELSTKEDDVIRIKKELEKLIQLSEKNERERLDLKSEVRHLSGELEHCRNEMENQDALSEKVKGKKEQELSAKIKNKNKQIHQLLDDVKELESENEKLHNQVSEMKHKIEDAVNQMDNVTTDYIALKEAYQQSETAIRKLNNEKEIYQSEVLDLQSQLQLKHDTDNEIMMTVSERVEEWKNVLSSKEEELAACEALIGQLKKQLVTAKLDSDRATLIALTKTVEDQDEQIQVLRGQLEQATQDLEENTVLMEGFLPMSSSHPQTPSTSNNSRRVSLALELQYSLRERTQEIERLQAKVTHLEEEGEKKDRELSHSLIRMRQYEMGEYGLADAVTEIKECKGQLRLRDSHIEELTQQLNYAEVNLNEYAEENQDLREKIGIQPSSEGNVVPAAPKKKLKLQSDVLKEKVEKLEEENLELQHQIHKLSMSLKRRNMQDELDTDNKEAKRGFLSEADQNSGLSTRQIEAVQWLQAENEDLHKSFLSVRHENEQLHQGMKEILHELREKDGEIDMILKCPTLEKLVQAIEVHEFTGQYDPLWVLKSRVDQLQGENDALRSELKCAKTEASSNATKLRRAESKIELLERSQKKSSRSPSISHGNDTFTLDQPRAGSTASLNGVQDLNPDEPLSTTVDDPINKTETVPPPLVDKFPSPSRLELLYQQYFADRDELDAFKEKWLTEKEELLYRRDQDKVKAEQLDGILNTLKADESDLKKELSGLNYKITLLLINESRLGRRYSMLQDIEKDLRKENEVLKKEIVFVETAAMEQIGELRRSKEMYSSRLSALRKILDESVPQRDLELANHRFTELSIKYRDLLERHHSVSSLQRQDVVIQQQLQKLQNENQLLMADLAVEKEKVGVLDNFRAGLEEGNVVKSSKGSNGQQAVLLLKEANERQRADHAVFQYEQLRASFTHLEARNKELEKTVSEVTAQNLQLQADLTKVTDKVEGSVPKDVYELDQSHLHDIESQLVELKQEAAEAKCLADVARHQSQFLETANKSLQGELEMVRQQIGQLQEESDEKLNIGKLYRKVLTLQLNEASLLLKVEQARSQIKVLEARCLRLELKCDETEEKCFHIQNQCHSKVTFLKQVLDELRRQYSGAVPLLKQEKVYKETQQLREEKLVINKERLEYLDRALASESRSEELLCRCQTLEEANKTLKSSSSQTPRALEWHQRMETLQLQAIRSNKACERSNTQASHLESQLEYLEKRVSELEVENASLEKALWERRLLLEDPSLSTTQESQPPAAPRIAFASLPEKLEDKFQLQTNEALPKRDLSLDEKDLKLNKSELPENEDLKKKILLLERKLRLAEEGFLSRDEALTELRLQFPTGSQVVAYSQHQGEIPLDQHYEQKQALKVAQATIACLQARLSQKSESLSHHQELLSRLRQENTLLQIQQEDEVRALHERLQLAQRQELLSSTKSALARTLSDEEDETSSRTTMAGLVSECGRLEEVATLQEHTLASLSRQLLSSRQDAAIAREEVQLVTRTLQEEFNRDLDELRSALLDKESFLEAREAEISDLRRGLEAERQAAASNSSLNEVVQELRTQISLKEEQMQLLKQAMSELRSEMDEVIKETPVKPPGSSPTAATLSNRIWDHRIKELQEKVENLEVQRSRLAKEVTEKSGIAERLQIDVEALRIHLEQKDSILARTIMERDEVKRKVERLKERGNKSEISELQQQVHYLEEQLQRHLPAEKPYVEDERAEKSREEIARWEEGKRWQGTVERLRHKLKLKEEEADSLERTSKTLREQVVRLGREKGLLENRVKALGLKNSSPDFPSIQEIRRKNSALEEEVQALKKECLKVANPAELEELRKQNQLLLEKLQDVEKQLAKHILHKESPKSPCSHVDENISSLKVKTNSLQKQVLKLSEEKFELKVSLERLRVDLPRLQQEKETLEAYVGALRTQLAQKDNLNNLTFTKNTVNANIAIQAAEKDSIASDTKTVEAEGDKKLVFSGSTQALLNTKTARIVAENKKQQQELKKLQGEVDKLRHQNRLLEEKSSEMGSSLEQRVQELNSLRALVPSPHTMNPKQYKAYVVTRIYEGKLRATEDQLKEKSKQLENSLQLLREATLETETLLTERNHLREKVEAYERATLVTGADLEDQLRHARTTIVKLESENNEFLSRLAGLDVLSDQERRGIPSVHERLLNENAQLRVQLRVTQMQLQTTSEEVKKLREDVDHARENLQSCENHNVTLLEQNRIFEDQLTQMAQQFGFSTV